jgi:hypothetical protein
MAEIQGTFADGFEDVVAALSASLDDGRDVRTRWVPAWSGTSAAKPSWLRPSPPCPPDPQLRWYVTA